VSLIRVTVTSSVTLSTTLPSFLHAHHQHTLLNHLQEVTFIITHQCNGFVVMTKYPMRLWVHAGYLVSEGFISLYQTQHQC